jgi:hypothetical protein
MHWRTFERLVTEHEHLRRRCVAALGALLQSRRRRLGTVFKH